MSAIKNTTRPAIKISRYDVILAGTFSIVMRCITVIFEAFDITFLEAILCVDAKSVAVVRHYLFLFGFSQVNE